MRKMEVTDILNAGLTKEQTLECLKLWLTTDTNIWIGKLPKRKWWQFWK